MMSAQSPAVDLPVRLPVWTATTRAETLDGATFLSGAALSTLDMVLRRTDLPQALLRDRQALRAAEACMVVERRPERAADLRDALHLLRPGDAPGPAGACFDLWRRVAARPFSVAGLAALLPAHLASEVPRWLEQGRGLPVAQAVAVLEAALAEAPREEAVALVLADWRLAQALNWPCMVPLLALGLSSRDLRGSGPELHLACHRALRDAAGEALHLGADLIRRAARLQAVAPKLRAKGAGAAVALFLRHDALVPGALPDMSDRAGRRLCDRLVTMGAVRELSGRASFRFYGL